jgi:hypothetical protein
VENVIRIEYINCRKCHIVGEISIFDTLVQWELTD